MAGIPPQAFDQAPPDWWKSFFDADYLRLWSQLAPQERTDQEAEGLWQLLDLTPGARVLDAPCGYGRLSMALARRGAHVVGVDFSASLLEQAEDSRGDLREDQLSFHRHDLRQPLERTGFDAAINVFSSLGYGTEEDDLAILRTLANAVHPGGLLFVDTMHRDACAALQSRGAKPAQRFPDGTLMLEEPRLDPVSGRVETTWYWSGPHGSGSKTASLRVYTLTELVRLLEKARLDLRSLHKGCNPEPFQAAGPDMGGRVGLLAVRRR
jgi:2-polyprenyl-3-methyl-5-hydroxy-6-metoxy-1,4-benzoquinol methylase